MANARIEIEVDGVDKVRQNLDAVRKLIQDASQSVGQIDPFKSLGDFGRLKQYADEQRKILVQSQKDIQKEIAEIQKQYQKNPDQARREIEAQYESASKEITQRFRRQRDQIRTRAESGEITPEQAEQYMSASRREEQLSRQDISKERAAAAIAIEKGDFSQFYQKQAEDLSDVNKQLVEFEGALKTITEGLKKTQRTGTTPDTLQGLATRQAGKLEDLRLREGAGRVALSEAVTDADVLKRQRELKAIQDQIDRLEGGTAASAALRQTAQQGGRGATAFAAGVGGALGGATGQVTSAGINLFSAAREAATIDPAKIAGATLAFTGIAGATIASLLLPRGQELLEARRGVFGLTGGQTGEEAGLANRGVSAAQFNTLARQTALELGVSGQRGTIGRSTRQRVGLEQDLGLDAGALSPLLQSFKYFADGQTDVAMHTAKTAAILEKSGLINSEKGSFEKLPGAIARIASVNEMQIQRGNQINMNTSAKIVGALEKIGGGFAGEAGMARLAQLDQAITNPQNEFTQAFLFETLSKSMPGASLSEIMERQQQGITNPENFNLLMTALSQQTGGPQSELFLQNVSNMFTGGNIANARQLIRGTQTATGFALPTDELAIGDAERLRRNIQGRNLATGATQLNTELENLLQTKGADLSQSTVDAINKLRSTLTTAIDNPKQLLEDVASEFTNVDNWKKVGKQIGDSFMEVIRAKFPAIIAIQAILDAKDPVQNEPVPPQK